MGISIQQFGKHEDVLFLDFGSGDILVSPGAEIDENGNHMIMLSQLEPGEIGRERADLKGKSSDEVENVKCVLRFSHPKSISVVIGKLAEIQEALFDVKLKIHEP